MPPSSLSSPPPLVPPPRPVPWCSHSQLPQVIQPSDARPPCPVSASPATGPAAEDLLPTFARLNLRPIVPQRRSVPESREGLYHDTQVESREYKVGRRTRRCRDARPECAASPTTRTDSHAFAEHLVLRAIFPWASRCLHTREFWQRSDEIARPAASSKPAEPTRGSANGYGGRSDFVTVLLGPGPGLLSFET